MGTTDGISMLPTLLGTAELQSKHDYLYWELYEPRGINRAVRTGKWKAVMPNARKPEVIELYDMEQDENERTDLAAQYPERVAELKKLMTHARVPSPFWDVKHRGAGFNAMAACEATGLDPNLPENQSCKGKKKKSQKQKSQE